MTWETQKKLQVPGFSVAQLWQLQPIVVQSEPTDAQYFPLASAAVSPSLSTTLPFK